MRLIPHQYSSHISSKTRKVFQVRSLAHQAVENIFPQSFLPLTSPKSLFDSITQAWGLSVYTTPANTSQHFTGSWCPEASLYPLPGERGTPLTADKNEGRSNKFISPCRESTFLHSLISQGGWVSPHRSRWVTTYLQEKLRWVSTLFVVKYKMIFFLNRSQTI